MGSELRPSKPLKPEEPADLGFGSVVSVRSRRRLLNRDGSFNVVREGLRFWESLSPYHSLITMGWGRFLGIVAGCYLAANAVFALAYTACGPSALRVPPGTAPEPAFLRAFFFSVQTFATIGYGHMYPAGLVANLLVTVESLFGLLVFALIAGLIFARFSRPTAQILFTRHALVAPYRGGAAFEFRIVNRRSNQILELEAKVLFSRIEGVGAERTRRFSDLTLERHKVTFFPLSWTILHPIDESSPLWGLTPADLARGEAEFLILLTGIDETFSQSVHARSSYKPEEILWGARFADVFNQPLPEGTLSIDVGRLDAIDRAELPG